MTVDGLVGMTAFARRLVLERSDTLGLIGCLQSEALFSGLPAGTLVAAIANDTLSKGAKARKQLDVKRTRRRCWASCCGC
jgi:hypothetical protein